jgi:phospholipase/carboxylesterase
MSMVPLIPSVRARVTRRQLITIGLAGIGSLLSSACADLVRGSIEMARNQVRRADGETAQDGRLRARPTAPITDGTIGLHALGLADGRDALIYVPGRYQPDHPAPLVLSLHGAGGNEQGGLYPLQTFADETGLILLSPASRGRTWDMILRNYGPDIDFIDQALSRAFEQYAIDPNRLAVGGFSDGASYALSIGLTNGDLFNHVLAFSPGFASPAAQRGSPGLYVSHGTQDSVLPIDVCSRRIVPMLKQAGYDVTYHEFDGPHTVPPEIAHEALDWFLST